MNKLFIYTIYDHPKDFPQNFVIKKWEVNNGDLVQDPNYLFRSEELEPCRQQMRQMGLCNIPRDATDDPVIVESWM